MTLRLWRLFKARLVAEHMVTPYQTLERPLVRCSRAWSAAAFRSTPMCCRGSRAISRKNRRRSRPKSRTSPASRSIPAVPKQIGDMLFGKMKLPGGRKTKTGAWSTSASVLDDLAEEGHLLPTKILEWRQITKLQSTYTDLLPSFVNPDTGRVHTNYALASTTTGRLSSFDPNLQNIPIRTEEGRKIRRAFIARRAQLLSADYSPDRAAASRRDRRYRGAQAGVPRPHRHSCADRERDVRRAGRRHAGRGAPPRQGDQFRHHLRHLGVRPRQSARHSARGSRRLYQEIFRALPRHPRLYGGTKEACRRDGYVTTLFGRKMPLSRTLRRRTPRSAPSTSAPPSMPACKAPPPTSSAAPWSAWTTRSPRSGSPRRCCCRSTTNSSSKCRTRRSTARCR